MKWFIHLPSIDLWIGKNGEVKGRDDLIFLQGFDTEQEAHCSAVENGEIDFGIIEVNMEEVIKNKIKELRAIPSYVNFAGVDIYKEWVDQLEKKGWIG